MVVFEDSWMDKVSNYRQIGGIETSVLDNGNERGVRIAWLNTGTGMRCKVILDRSMDIAEAFFNEYGLSWISHSGVTPPQSVSDQGLDWLRTFGGGLLTTCGLSHVGGPESDDFGNRGLHGRISGAPAELLSIVQPDPMSGEMDMSITGRMKESSVLGTKLELTRTITCRLGEPILRIRDVVRNVGNQTTPLMMLYHFNLGWPLVDEGSEIFWEGSWQSREEEKDRVIFRPDHNFYTCPAPMSSHSGAGEEACFIDPDADSEGICRCGIINDKIGVKLTISFKKDQLPCLTNWQHWGVREYVTGLEPGTNFPIGQRMARQEGNLRSLEPGASKTVNLTINVENINETDK